MGQIGCRYAMEQVLDRAELGAAGGSAHAGQDSQFAIAIKIEAFVDIDPFKTRVDDAIRQIHACRRAPGVERLYAPGELEFLQREEFARNGIPLNPVTLGDLTQTARALNVDIRPFTWLPQT
jgi:LDH2 family malate/lactate/ureidoglycolate dehydrogenase